jgi:hypothetical protein
MSFTKRILRRRPSPALIISVVALFAAMGGTAYALTITGANIKTNSVTGTDLRDIKGGDIRNYSITGKDIKKDGLGRVPIKEERLDASKIGKVKSAADADGVAGAAAKRITAFTLPDGSSRELLRTGPLVLTARCRTAGANQVAEVIVQTSTNGAAVDGAQKDTSFNVGETAQLAASSAATGTPAFDQESSGAAIAADGTEILGQDLYTGASVLGQANVCRFGGIVYVG